MEEKIPSSPKPNPEPTPRPQNATISGRVVPITRTPPPLPPHRPRRRQRSCLCSSFLFLLFLLIAIVFISAIAAGIFYVMYRPCRPAYSVSSLDVVSLNSTGADQLSSRLNLTVTAANPNTKIAFLYDPIYVTATRNGARIAVGSFMAFAHGTKNVTTLRTLMEGFSGSVGGSVAKGLKRSARGLEVEIEMETRVRVKIGGFESKKIGARVSCAGVEAVVASNRTVNKLKGRCEISLLIQTWKWTF